MRTRYGIQNDNIKIYEILVFLIGEKFRIFYIQKRREGQNLRNRLFLSCFCSEEKQKLNLRSVLTIIKCARKLSSASEVIKTVLLLLFIHNTLQRVDSRDNNGMSLTEGYITVYFSAHFQDLFAKFLRWSRYPLAVFEAH